ncbi:unnamed protein product [Mytilus edulis]|uniref:Uncharacterized protein n=1 Tax=Mytilus edulis TaxID=6550 RepID=A0A8S3TG94_MYTED|nr:unnamed protein product [Mytilus edulis]
MLQTSYMSQGFSCNICRELDDDRRSLVDKMLEKARSKLSFSANAVNPSVQEAKVPTIVNLCHLIIRFQVSHEIEDEISMGGSAISDENNNDAHSQSQPSYDKEFSLFSEGAPGSTDPIQWNNFLHKLTVKLKIDCSEETEVESVRTSYLPSRLNPGNSDKASHLTLLLEC